MKIMVKINVIPRPFGLRAESSPGSTSLRANTNRSGRDGAVLGVYTDKAREARRFALWCS